MKVTVNELKDGTVARISIAQFAKLSNEHLNTMSRKLRENRFTAITDPVTGRIYIPAESALAYLEGKPYKHNRLNAEGKDKAAKTASSKGAETHDVLALMKWLQQQENRPPLYEAIYAMLYDFETSK